MYQACVAFNSQWTLQEGQLLLNTTALQQYDLVDQHYIVRHWLQQQGCLAPSRQLEQIFESVIAARVDSEPLFQLDAAIEFTTVSTLLMFSVCNANTTNANPVSLATAVAMASGKCDECRQTTDA